MAQIGVTVKSIFCMVASFIATMLGGWDMLFFVLLFFVIIDFITGVVASAFQGQLSSRIGFKGISQKIMIFSLVAVAHLLDLILSGTSNFIRDAVIFFYIFNELLSIIENAGTVGVPIPRVLRRAVEVLRKRSGE